MEYDLQAIRVHMLLAATGGYYKNGKAITLDEAIKDLKNAVSSLKVKFICTSCDTQFERYPLQHGCLQREGDNYKILSVNQFLNNYYKLLKHRYGIKN